MTKIEREFQSDLKDLLSKYNAEISIEECTTPWGTTPHIEVYIPSEWDRATGETIRPEACIKLGDDINANDLACRLNIIAVD